MTSSKAHINSTHALQVHDIVDKNNVTVGSNIRQVLEYIAENQLFTVLPERVAIFVRWHTIIRENFGGDRGMIEQVEKLGTESRFPSTRNTDQAHNTHRRFESDYKQETLQRVSRNNAAGKQSTVVSQPTIEELLATAFEYKYFPLPL